MSAYFTVKRMADVVLASGGLLVAGPILVVTAVAIKAETRGPVLFKQSRVGCGQQLFTIYKFRSMAVGHGTMTQTFDASPGVTQVGRVLRRTKLDELPQLWNVLIGDMSLVGPRPPLPNSLSKMPTWAQRRFAVRPGLTGLAQVSGNVALPWDERWRYDVVYVDGICLAADLRILLRTAKVVLFGENRGSVRGAI